MREADRIECQAYGRSPKDALRFCLRSASVALTAVDEETGRPLAMMGLSPVSIMTGEASIWMLGVDDVFHFARDLIVVGPVMIDWWLTMFKTLENKVALDNDRAIRLLSHWGATFPDERETIGGVEFIPFRFERAIHRQQIEDHTEGGCEAHSEGEKQCLPLKSLRATMK